MTINVFGGLLGGLFGGGSHGVSTPSSWFVNASGVPCYTNSTNWCGWKLNSGGQPSCAASGQQYDWHLDSGGLPVWNNSGNLCGWKFNAQGQPCHMATGTPFNWSFDQKGYPCQTGSWTPVKCPDGIVQGTAFGDLIDFNYVGDPQGDQIDHNDALLTGEAPQDDIVEGGAGNDTILSGLGNDDVYGGTGDDSIYGGDGDDILRGEDGNDRIWGDNGNDVIQGGNGNDTLSGGAGNDAVDGGTGNDMMSGGDGIDTLFGGANDDVMAGELGDDRLFGGDGNDTITGGGGADIVIGGDGDDVITTTAAGEGDTSFGGTGNDTFVLSNSFFTGHIHGDAGTDDHADASAYVGFALIADLVAGSYNDGGLVFDMTGIEHVTGGTGDDVFTGDDAANRLTGNAGNDSLFGGGGSDTITGGAGADSLDGGADTDTLSYARSALGVEVFLALNSATGGDAAGDTITGFENLIGSGQNDDLLGSGGDNVIGGAGGDDFIVGFTGTDTLRGGVGNDTVAITTFDPATAGSVFDGGADSDRFRVAFNTAATSVNLNDFTIQGFETLEIFTEFAGPAVTASISASGFAFQFTAVEIDHNAATAATLAIGMGGELALDLSTRTFTGFTLPGDQVMVIGDGEIGRAHV